jgi:hypothetical protein
MMRRRLWADSVTTLAIAAAVFLVNLSYPEWTGGWSTGPRLLVPLLPFAMVPVAALLAAGGPIGRLGSGLAVVLAVAGGILMLLFQGVGGRVIQDVTDPLFDAVFPLWIDQEPLPPWWPGSRFARNVVSVAAGEAFAGWPLSWQRLPFLLLAAVQAVAIGLAWSNVGRTKARSESEEDAARAKASEALLAVDPREAHPA